MNVTFFILIEHFTDKLNRSQFYQLIMLIYYFFLFLQIIGNSSKKKEPTKSLKNSKRLKRTGTEEILLNDDLPSIINKDL